jgi:hypothetical protein
MSEVLAAAHAALLSRVELFPQFDAEQLRSRTARAVVWGWASGKVPREQDGALFMGDIGAKSDWFDRAQGRVRENLESLEIFRGQ